MTEHLNAVPLGTEQVEALERIVDSILEHSPEDHTGHTIAQATKRLIVDFRAERAAHQATKAELEAAREVIQTARWLTDRIQAGDGSQTGYQFAANPVTSAIARYDAARAGQGEGAE